MASSATTLLDSTTWLQAYGLQRQKLTLAHVLAAVGFKHSEAYVPGVGRPVEARYNRGLFPQYQGRDGTVHNLTASPELLERLARKIVASIDLYKKRLEFLTSGSRRAFGAVHARRPVVVINAGESPRPTGAGPDANDVINVISDVIHEQLAGKEAFNMIWAGSEVRSWRDSCSPHLNNDSRSSADDAVSWLRDQCGRQSGAYPSAGSGTGSSAVEALGVASLDRYADGVYFFTEGSLSDRCRYLLQNKAQTSGIPVNVVAFNCNDRSTIDALQTVSKLSHGECMTSSSNQSDAPVSDEPHWMQYIKESPQLHDSVADRRPVVAWPEVRPPPVLPSHASSTVPHQYGGDGMHVVRSSVQLVWDELEDARNILAELQALSYDLPRRASAPLPLDKPKSSLSPRLGDKDATPHRDLYLSSREWLRVHGLSARKLLLHDALSGLAFRHCDSIVKFHNQLSSIGGDITPTSQDRLVGAKYCGNFAHFRWPDGSVVHIHVTQEVVRKHRAQVTRAIDSYLGRIEWLRQGSRELFGTLIEDKVCILVDVSSSMKNRLDLVKAKLQVLLQEQLRHKLMFNVVRFGSNAVSWRPTLVHVTSQSLQEAWRWVLSLNAGGSTNTLGALRLALADPSVQAVYLLTDGRPDQPTEGILAQVQLTSKVPIHTISFNCADSQANTFLYQLAKETGGRYHYFSEDAVDEHGPRPYESEDIQLLQQEMDAARSDLGRLVELREECMALEKRQSTLAASKSLRKATDSKRPWSSPAATRKPASSRSRPSPQPSSSRSTLQKTAKSGRRQPQPSSSPPPASDRVADEQSDVTTDYASQAPSARSSTSASSSAVALSAAESDDGERPEAAESDRSPVASAGSEVSLAASDRSDRSLVASAGSEVSLAASDDPASTAGSASSTGKMRRPKAKKPVKSKATPAHRSSETWLDVHGLAANRLTILDALRPTVIEQRSTFVPILNKHVASKVFDNIMTMRHVADDTGDVSIVNPQAVDLKAYEGKLASALAAIEDRLDTIVWSALPSHKRSRFSSKGPVSFTEHRDELLRVLEELRWPVRQRDIMLLAAELQKGSVYMKQSISLRDTSAANDPAGVKNILSNPDAMKATLRALTPSTSTKTTAKPRASSSASVKSRGRTPLPARAATSPAPPTPKLTLARFDEDGYFYEASVSNTLNARNIVVSFANGQEQRLAKRHLISVDTTKSRPRLMVGDCILVQTSLPIPGAEDHQVLIAAPAMACFVPAQVTVVPRQSPSSTASLSSSTAFYTVRLYTSCKITTFREDMIKISQSQYSFAIRYIVSVEKATAGVQFTLFPEAASPYRSVSSSPQGHQDRQDVLSPLQAAQSTASASAAAAIIPPTNTDTPPQMPPDGTPQATPRSKHTDDDDAASMASSASSAARQRRFSTHTLQQLSEQTGQLHALQGELVASAARDKAGIAEQCAALVQRHEEAMALSQQLGRQHAAQARDLREQLVAEHRTQQEALGAALASSSAAEEQRRRQALDEHQRHASSLSSALDEQGAMQRTIGEQQRRQEQAFAEQRRKLIAVVDELERERRHHSDAVAAERRRQSDEHSERRRELAAVLADMQRLQDGLQGQQAQLERAQAAVAATAERVADEITPVGSPRPSAPASPLQGSLSGLLEQLPEGAKLESVQTSDGEEAILVRHGDVGVIVSPSHLRESSAAPGLAPPELTTRPLLPGEEVIARSEEDGWYFPGIIQDVHDNEQYSVANGCGLLETVSHRNIVSDNDDCDNDLSPGDPVLALHPSFVNSYAPGYIKKLKSNGKFKVAFYDGKTGYVERQDAFLISPERFTEAGVFIRQREASFVGTDVVARYDQDGFYYPGHVMSQLGPSHSYAVQFSQSGVLHTQLIQHVFSHRTSQPSIALGSRVLAPILSDKSVYLPGWVSSEKDNLLTISFIDGQQCRSVASEDCYWMSTLYYNQSTRFFKHLPSSK